MQIVWLKRNLRLQDSEPFYEAMRSFRRFGPVLVVYIHEPSLIQEPDVSRQHQLFVQETLSELDSEICSIGGQLLQLVGEATAVFQKIHSVRRIVRIHSHQETTQASQYTRDKAVGAWCYSAGVEFVQHAQNGVARPGTSQIPKPFAEYFADCVHLTLKDPRGVDLSDRFACHPVPPASMEEVPFAQDDDKPLRLRGGRSNAEKILRDFFTVQRINQYPFKLSSPNTAWDGCSRLSAYLAYGVVSDREVLQAVDRVVTAGHATLDHTEFAKLQDRARFYLDRLMWRRSYIQNFENHPSLEFEPAIAHFKGVREAAYEPELVEKWSRGLTGFPFIDALMRCLHKTGWINMRGRATVLSFATMNLWQPVPVVARVLARQFLDYDPGIHFPIHQVVSGTAAPENGIMVYDPVKQGMDHDPQGAFIRRWVPELADLQGDDIHHFSKTAGHLSQQASRAGLFAYPPPMLDHKITGREAKRRVNDLQKGNVGAGGNARTALAPQMGLL